MTQHDHPHVHLSPTQHASIFDPDLDRLMKSADAASQDGWDAINLTQGQTDKGTMFYVLLKRSPMGAQGHLMPPGSSIPAEIQKEIQRIAAILDVNPQEWLESALSNALEGEWERLEAMGLKRTPSQPQETAEEVAVSPPTETAEEETSI